MLKNIALAAAVLFSSFTAQAGTQNDFCSRLDNDAKGGQWFKDGQLVSSFFSDTEINTETGRISMYIQNMQIEPGKKIEMRLRGFCKNNVITELNSVGSNEPNVELKLTGKADDGKTKVEGQGSDGANYVLTFYPRY